MIIHESRGCAYYGQLSDSSSSLLIDIFVAMADFCDGAAQHLQEVITAQSQKAVLWVVRLRHFVSEEKLTTPRTAPAGM